MITAKETMEILSFQVKLRTQTKLFCGCPVTPGAGCPVCNGMPGSLPVLNRKAVEDALTVALSCGCRITEETVFERKHETASNYPHNYRITQHNRPLATGGSLVLDGMQKELPLRRIYLEATEIGMPLLCLETEAGSFSEEERKAAAQAVYRLVRKLGISDEEVQAVYSFENEERKYQYIQEPDLVPLRVENSWIEHIRNRGKERMDAHE